MATALSGSSCCALPPCNWSWRRSWSGARKQRTGLSTPDAAPAALGGICGTDTVVLLCNERPWWYHLSGAAFQNHAGACGEPCGTQSTSQQAPERAQAQARKGYSVNALLGIWLFAEVQPELVTGFSIGLVCFTPCNVRADCRRPKVGAFPYN